MEVTPHGRGAVVDARLAPAGLTRLLGSYGAGRGSVLVLAAALIVAACGVRVLTPAPSVAIGLTFIVAVTLAVLGWSGESVATIIGRAAALLFLAPLVGRAAERASQSRRLLEQVLEATTDSIYVKDLEGRYLIVNSATAQLIGRSGQEIIGRTNAELLPDVADDVAAHDTEVLDAQASVQYEIAGHFGERRYILSVTKSPFCDASGHPIGSLGIAREITDQRRLQEESTRFFDLSGDILATIGFDGCIRRVNGELTRRLGWAADDLLGASIFDFLPADEHAAMASATRDAPDVHGGRRLTTRWRAKDGSLHWIQWSLRTVLDDRVVYASGRDVTQELLAERALAGSESRYRALVDGLPDTAVFLVDTALQVEFAAGQSLHDGAIMPAQLIGDHVGAILPLPQSSALADACSAALDGDERSLDIVSAEHGHALWLRTSPLRGDEPGQVTGAMLIVQDIRRRVEREREIGEAQERFRRAFEDAPIGMAVATLDGRFLQVNQALCAITGYTAADLTGTTFSRITHPEDVDADLEVMRGLIAGELHSSVDEKRYLRPDGSIVWVARSVTLVRDADGRPLHLFDQIQDITERRRFEHELRQLADHDPLTGLLNRRRFEQELDRHVAEVERYGPRGALLVLDLDLDHFKYVNDAFGHHAGDELILSVAALLQDRLRATDTLARLGGDEFAVLLPHADAGEAEHVAETLVRAVREQAAVSADGRRRRVTTSIGIAPFARADVGGEELLIEADLAMYEAKEAGRDRYAVVSPDAQRPARCCGSSRPRCSARRSTRAG